MPVIDLAQARADRTPHLGGEAKCLACSHEWAAVAPVGVMVLQCPACSLERGRFTGNVIRAEKHWTCHCGNDLFHICPEGTYCPACGEWQAGFSE